MRYLRDLREGLRVLCSRGFWRGFRDYWSVDAVSARIDDFTARFREQTDQEPDWDVERRRARRSVHRDDE
jgi:hypothetical protein